MPELDAAEVARLAGLARIQLTESQTHTLAGQLGVILDAVATVSAAIPEGTAATSHPLPLENVWREDEVGPLLSQEEALSGAPAAEDGRFLVPQILDEEA